MLTARRRRNWLGSGFSKHRIDEGRSGAFAGFFNKLDRLIHGRVRGYSLKKMDLVDAHAQRGADFDVECLHAIRQIAIDQEIEQTLPPQDAQRDFRCESGICRADSLIECCAQGFVRVRVLSCNAEEDFVRNGSRRRDRHEWIWEHSLTKKKTLPKYDSLFRRRTQESMTTIRT